MAPLAPLIPTVIVFTTRIVATGGGLSNESPESERVSTFAKLLMDALVAETPAGITAPDGISRRMFSFALVPVRAYF